MKHGVLRHVRCVEKNNWNIDETIVTPLGIDGDKNVHLGGQFMPIVAVTCNNCGNVVFINPLAIDAIEE